ncbi:MAG: hypothetical protein ACK4UO_12930 [Pseudolabrys sp.]
MKKTIIAVAIALALPFAAFADTQDGGGNPALLTMPWGLTGGETPTFASGTSITDPWGKVFTCPWFFPAGCYNITHTAWYAAHR